MVLRTGAIIAHVNVLATLPTVLKAFAQIDADSMENRPIGEALAAHESAMHGVRDCLGAHTVGAAVHSLAPSGHPQQAKRLRAGARARAPEER